MSPEESRSVQQLKHYEYDSKDELNSVNNVNSFKNYFKKLKNDYTDF